MAVTRDRTCDRLEREGWLADLGGELDAHVDSCEVCRARRDEYLGLARAIGRGESARALPPQWKERTLRRVWAARAAARRRRLVGMGLAAAAAAALLLVFLFQRRDPAPVGPAALALRVVEGSGAWRGDARLGDELQATASAGEWSWFELRIYHETRRLLLRCPGTEAPGCRVSTRGVEAALPLASVGAYQVVWLGSDKPAPQPAGNLDADVQAARAAGAHVIGSETIHVY